MKDLLTNMFKAKDKADEELRQYQADIARKQAHNDMLAEQARGMQNIAHNPYAQAVPKPEGGAITGSGYTQGWSDPRAAMLGQRAVTIDELHHNVAQANQTVKVLYEKVMRTERKVEQLSGFYHWITEVHPELAAQYKAMRELYDAANNLNPPQEMMGS